MNQYLIAHITAEVFIIGGLSYYFMKKSKQAEEQIKLLETRLQDLESKVKSSDKHIQSLYQMLEGLAEQEVPRQRRGGYMNNAPRFVPDKPDSLRNRKQKMTVIPMKIDEDEEVIELEPSNGPSMHGNTEMEDNPFGSFPLGAIFEMMGPRMSSGPMGGLFHAASASSQDRPKQTQENRGSGSLDESSVIIEDDDRDIQDELKELGVQPIIETEK
jgi:hypothetical protein